MFRFRLQRVFEIRQRQEQLCNQEYASTMGAHQATLEKIRLNQSGLVQANLKADTLAQSNPNPVRHALHHQFKQRMRQEEADLTLLAAQQWQAAEAKREALVQAHQRSEVLKRLKRKKQAQYLHSQKRAEQIDMDEIAINTVICHKTWDRRP